MKTMAFIRDFTGFSGGHLKVFDYFNHVAQSGIFCPVLTLTARSRRDHTNPWIAAGISFSETIGPSDAYFVAGLDWDILDIAGIDCREKPVVNLIQHVRHGWSQDARYRFLTRPALRICVSEEVANAIRATGSVNGEVITIPNGIGLEAFMMLRDTPKEQDVFIGGLKSAALAIACADVLRAKGLRVACETAPLPREDYVKRVASARVALLLPNRAEGFYLPALEAMASDVCVVVPDCVGNRSFCVNGLTCVMPSFELKSLTQAVIDLAAHPERQEALKREARKMVANHDLVAERSRFQEVLSRLDRFAAC